MKKKFLFVFALSIIFISCSKPEKEFLYDIHNRTIEETYEEHNLGIKAVYPQIVIDGKNEIENKINSYIENFVSGLITGFKEEVTDNDFPEEDFGNSFDMNSEILFKGKKILSIRFDNYRYFAGAAHGLSIATVMNFDLSTGNLIELKDYFTMDNYLEVISSYCVEDLKKQLTVDEYEPDIEWIESGAGPDLINYQVYAFLEKELFIVFNQYQVAPYAVGLPEVSIPYENFRNNIKREEIK